MIEVEILDSNIDVFKESVMLDTLDFSEFIEITEAMNSSEFIQFCLLDESGHSIYKGTFEKKVSSDTFENDLAAKIESLLKRKKLTKEEAIEFFTKIAFDVPLFLQPRNKQQKKKKLTGLKIGKKGSPRMWAIFFCIVGLFVIAFIFLQNFRFSEVSPQKTVETTTSTEDPVLSMENYLEIASRDASRKEEIANFLAEKEDYERLEQFQKEYPTSIGQFELAFNEKDWDTVIQADISSLNENRSLMLAFAFLAKGMPNEAKTINQTLKNDELSEQIAILFLRQGNIKEAEVTQKSLKNEDLLEFIDSAKIFKEMITYYRKEKDQENEKIWQRKLENIGSAILPDSRTFEKGES